MLSYLLIAALATADQTPAKPAEAKPAAKPAEAKPAAVDAAIPPAEDAAKAALEKSTRHGEYVDLKVPGETVALRTWVVYPERKDKAPVVILIHEIFGLSDWMRATADQLAKDGFIAVAPDLISGKGPNGGGTDSAASKDDVVKLIRGLTPEETVKKLDAVRDYALKIPAANGKLGVVGFCWGGSMSFLYATAQPALGAAVVYYGTSPETPKLATVKAPVLGLYGADDARVNATIDAAAAEMKKLGKTYEPTLFDGAGHAFLRNQTARDGANLKAAQKGWAMTVEFFRKHLGK